MPLCNIYIHTVNVQKDSLVEIMTIYNIHIMAIQYIQVSKNEEE